MHSKLINMPLKKILRDLDLLKSYCQKLDLDQVDKFRS